METHGVPGLMLRTAERSTYDTIWGLSDYAEFSPGESHVDLFMEMTGAKPRETVIDAGCGSGKGGLVLAGKGLDVILCDLTDSGLVAEARASLPFWPICLWDRINVGYLFGGKADWVYCCDVLEHIPPTFTMLVIARLLDIARKGVFLSIGLMPDAFGAFVGKPLHQTVQGFVDWKRQIGELGIVVEARDLLTRGIYLVRPC